MKETANIIQSVDITATRAIRLNLNTYNKIMAYVLEEEVDDVNENEGYHSLAYVYKSDSGERILHISLPCTATYEIDEFGNVDWGNIELHNFKKCDDKFIQSVCEFISTIF